MGGTSRGAGSEGARESELMQLQALARSIHPALDGLAGLQGVCCAIYARLTDCLYVGAKGLVGKKGWAALKALHYLLLFMDNNGTQPLQCEAHGGTGGHVGYPGRVHALVGYCCGHFVPVLLKLLDVRATQHSHLQADLQFHVFGEHGHRALDM